MLPVRVASAAFQVSCQRGVAATSEGMGGGAGEAGAWARAVALRAKVAAAWVRNVLRLGWGMKSLGEQRIV